MFVQYIQWKQCSHWNLWEHFPAPPLIRWHPLHTILMMPNLSWLNKRIILAASIQIDRLPQCFIGGDSLLKQSISSVFGFDLWPLMSPTELNFFLLFAPAWQFSSVKPWLDSLGYIISQPKSCSVFLHSVFYPCLVYTILCSVQCTLSLYFVHNPFECTLSITAYIIFILACCTLSSREYTVHYPRLQLKTHYNPSSRAQSPSRQLLHGLQKSNQFNIILLIVHYPPQWTLSLSLPGEHYSPSAATQKPLNHYNPSSRAQSPSWQLLVGLQKLNQSAAPALEWGWKPCFWTVAPP